MIVFGYDILGDVLKGRKLFLLDHLNIIVRIINIIVVFINL